MADTNELSEAERLLAKTVRRISILHDDAHMVAVDKPAGLLVVPDRFNTAAPTLVAEMTARLKREGKLDADGRLFVVHRIDRGTSGVVLFAKDRDTHRALSRLFVERSVKKTYEAIVHGEVANDAGRIDLPIGLKPGDRSRMTVRKRKGRESQTDFTVIERYLFYTHVRLEPLTGRQHQIRVHMSAIGHPVVCDDMYGGGHKILLSELKRSYRSKQGHDETPLMGRLALHASEAQFAHPADGRLISISADLPKDFRATLRNLGRFLRK